MAPTWAVPGLFSEPWLRLSSTWGHIHLGGCRSPELSGCGIAETHTVHVHLQGSLTSDDGLCALLPLVESHCSRSSNSLILLFGGTQQRRRCAFHVGLQTLQRAYPPVNWGACKRKRKRSESDVISNKCRQRKRRLKFALI